MGNSFKTALLLGILTALIVWIGNLLGGMQGMIIAFILAMAMNFFSYWYSDKIVLRMYRAKEIKPGEYPEVFNMVKRLAQGAKIPMPRIYIIPEQSPNAFATGRDPEHAVVAVTQGLLKLMNRDEIMGVLAHEMAHVKNRDILIGSIAATMAGAIMILANIARWSAFFGGGSGNDEEGGGLGGIGLVIMSILAPLAAVLIQMAISRSREYQADETGARVAGKAEGLASALEKLGVYARKLPLHAEPSSAHMFIVNPLFGRSLMQLFSTHPPLEERIARLRGQGTGMSVKKDKADRAKRDAAATWRRLSR